MSTQAQPAAQPPQGGDASVPEPRPGHFAQIRQHLPTVPEALASLLRTVVVALFLLTFLIQPFLIPSESM